VLFQTPEKCVASSILGPLQKKVIIVEVLMFAHRLIITAQTHITVG